MIKNISTPDLYSHIINGLYSTLESTLELSEEDLQQYATELMNLERQGDIQLSGNTLSFTNDNFLLSCCKNSVRASLGILKLTSDIDSMQTLSTLEYGDSKHSYDLPFQVFRIVLYSYEAKGHGEVVDSYNDVHYRAY